MVETEFGPESVRMEPLSKGKRAIKVARSNTSQLDLARLVTVNSSMEPWKKFRSFVPARTGIVAIVTDEAFQTIIGEMAVQVRLRTPFTYTHCRRRVASKTKAAWIHRFKVIF